MGSCESEKGDTMEWLLLVLGGSGAAVFARQAWARRDRRRLDRQIAATELEQVRRVADEDVTLLGEELRRLDVDVAGHDLDEETRADYQRALDAYESAQRTIAALRSADEISKVTDTLATGRYSMVCVRARVAGAPIPQRRVPCFFNPQHGPSVREVEWTPPGRGTRLVPACAQDAARVAARQKPDVRFVTIGSRKVPYYEAGALYAPYGQGYFVGAWIGGGVALAAYDRFHGFPEPVPSGVTGCEGGGPHGGGELGASYLDFGAGDGGGGDG
jgi:hypothetical protein